MLTLVEQVRLAYERSGWSLAELLRRSGLPIDRSTLGRKLLGDNRKGRGRLVRLGTEECEALARALGITLVVSPSDEASP